MKIKAVLSDMGGVIVDYRPPPACFDFIEDPESKMELIEPYWKQFESGLIAGRDFYEIFRKNFGYFESYENFRSDFSEGFQFELNKEVFDFILSLKTKDNGPILYMLSNINEFHFEHIDKRWPGVFSNFLRNFYSFKLKMMKPQPEIFLYAKEHINFSVYNTLFIDDKKENCDAARKVGFTAIQFESIGQLKADYAKLESQPEPEAEPVKPKKEEPEEEDFY